MINYDEKMKLFTSTINKKEGFVLFGKEREFPRLSFKTKEEIRVIHIKKIQDVTEKISDDNISDEDKMNLIEELLNTSYLIIDKVMGIKKKELLEEDLSYKDILGLCKECLSLIFGEVNEEEKKRI
jgi:hypothetical protein